eukprot:tig00001127_g7160.t1
MIGPVVEPGKSPPRSEPASRPGTSRATNEFEHGRTAGSGSPASQNQLAGGLREAEAGGVAPPLNERRSSSGSCAPARPAAMLIAGSGRASGLAGRLALVRRCLTTAREGVHRATHSVAALPRAWTGSAIGRAALLAAPLRAAGAQPFGAWGWSTVLRGAATAAARAQPRAERGAGREGAAEGAGEGPGQKRRRGKRKKEFKWKPQTAPERSMEGARGGGEEEGEDFASATTVKGLILRGRLEEAAQLFQRSLAEGTAAPTMLTDLLKGYMAAGGAPAARGLFDWAVANDLPLLNSYHWAAMLDGYRGAGDLRGVRELLGAMLARRVAPEQAALDPALLAVAASACRAIATDRNSTARDAGFGVAQAERLVEHAFREKAVTAGAALPLVELYAHFGRVQAALALIARCAAEGVAVTGALYAPVLRACADRADWAGGRALFERMRAEGTPPTTLLRGRMAEAGAPFDASSYGTVAREPFRVARETAAAEWWAREAKAAGCGGPGVHAALLAGAARGAGAPTGAERALVGRVLAEMKAERAPPDPRTERALLEFHNRAGQRQEAQKRAGRLVQMARAPGARLDSSAYLAVLEAHAQLGGRPGAAAISALLAELRGGHLGGLRLLGPPLVLATVKALCRCGEPAGSGAALRMRPFKAAPEAVEALVRGYEAAGKALEGVAAAHALFEEGRGPLVSAVLGVRDENERRLAARRLWPLLSGFPDAPVAPADVARVQDLARLV